MSLHRRTVVALAGAALAAGARAQGYSTRPVVWIVPFPAGGPTDALARDVAAHVGAALGQTILIENVAGAGGTVGAARAAQAAPDGYTLLVGHLGFMAAAPSLYRTLGYDPLQDFDPVFRFPDTPLVLLVARQSPFGNAEALIAFARRHPGRLNIGNAGLGSTSHLAAALFAQRAGIEATSVPYKGTAQALTDLMAGQIDAVFDQSNTALSALAGGRLRAIGLTSAQDLPQFPGVPALGRRLLPDFEMATWYGVYAPRGTPPDVVQRLYRAYARAMEDVAWKRQLADQGIRLLPDAQYAPDALARHTAAEVRSWRRVVTQARIVLD
ncbi:tripartite tricarboxylate transporter substrate-binding protein [uncultured Xylophilus sp.]|uniref:tripartite tricarboxylate transporter substrate-binding protein n=1 Tax=uncultured Xylophilus sp. TaxID=296832 RepID=UPI0025F6D4DE|nr:tripartite tricarboxylate transporter substrate-binding protein [uncultured Xylophilus sp.]